MDIQTYTDRLAACLGGVDNIIGMEAGEALLVIQVAHMEYVEIARIRSAPFIAEVITGDNSVSILTNDRSARELLAGLRLSETGREEIAESPFPIIGHLRKLMIPLLSTFLAGGIVQAVFVLILSFAIYQSAIEASGTISVISKLVFIILPVLIAFSSARYNKTNPYIAAGIAGMMIQPAVTDFVSNRVLEQFLNFSLVKNHQYNTILPILILIPFLAYLNRKIDGHLDGNFRPLLRPIILMGAGLLLGVVVLLPMMALISHVVVALFSLVAAKVPFLATTLMGLFGPLVVLTGTHFSFFDTITYSMETVGYDALIGPGMLISNAAHAGVALGLVMKSRKKLYRIYSGAACVLSLLGVSQPIIYGGELILKNLLWYVMLGGGVGGLVAGLFHLKMYQFINPSILSLPAFMDDTGNVLVAISSMLIAALIAFFLTISRPISELTDEEIRIATTGQGLDVIE